jgi:hypothetical protein
MSKRAGASSFQVLGILRRPMWYNTEESLLPVLFPGREVIAGFQFRF